MLPDTALPARRLRQPTQGRPVGAAAAAEPTVKLQERPDYERSRREADARQKRWDDRIRRATGGMCTGC